MRVNDNRGRQRHVASSTKRGPQVTDQAQPEEEAEEDERKAPTIKLAPVPFLERRFSWERS